MTNAELKTIALKQGWAVSIRNEDPEQYRLIYKVSDNPDDDIVIDGTSDVSLRYAARDVAAKMDTVPKELEALIAAFKEADLIEARKWQVHHDD